MSKKEELEEKIQQKERQLEMAQNESRSWNNGKYKKSSNAKISKIFVESLKKEISSLNDELAELSKNP